MSEYIIELPDSGAADEFVAKMGVYDCRIYGYRLNGEIVRCRDCAKSAEGRMFGGDAVTVCTRFKTYNYVTEPDGFCAWGARRGDAE